MVVAVTVTLVAEVVELEPLAQAAQETQVTVAMEQLGQ
jgi:ribonuclease PH